MPSFKIALNLFIIFINKFNDSINMIYCAIFIIFIPRHPRENLVDNPCQFLHQEDKGAHDRSSTLYASAQ